MEGWPLKRESFSEVNRWSGFQHSLSLVSTLVTVRQRPRLTEVDPRLDPSSGKSPLEFSSSLSTTDLFSLLAWCLLTRERDEGYKLVKRWDHNCGKERIQCKRCFQGNFLDPNLSYSQFPVFCLLYKCYINNCYTFILEKIWLYTCSGDSQRMNQKLSGLYFRILSFLFSRLCLTNSLLNLSSFQWDIIPCMKDSVFTPSSIVKNQRTVRLFPGYTINNYSYYRNDCIFSQL